MRFVALLWLFIAGLSACGEGSPVALGSPPIEASGPVALAYVEDLCTNAPDIEFRGQTWYSFSAIFQSWAEAGAMSGTFAVQGDVGTFTGDDGGVILYRRLDASGFRELNCSLGYTPG